MVPRNSVLRKTLIRKFIRRHSPPKLPEINGPSVVITIYIYALPMPGHRGILHHGFMYFALIICVVHGR